MTVFSVNPIISALEARRGRLEQIRENTARQAQSFAMLTTNGTGQVLHTVVVPFDCTFIEEPFVAYGFSMDGDTLIDGLYPSSTGGVWKWHQDRRGYYLGAYVFFVVDGDPSYALTHSFTFSATAIKDLPAHLMEA